MATVTGTNGNDVLSAATLPVGTTAGDDFIFGFAGNDLVLRSAGNDSIDGGEGFDALDYSGVFDCDCGSAGGSNSCHATGHAGEFGDGDRGDGSFEC